MKRVFTITNDGSETLVGLLAALEEHMPGDILIQDVLRITCKTEQAAIIVEALTAQTPDPVNVKATVDPGQYGSESVAAMPIAAIASDPVSEDADHAGERQCVCGVWFEPQRKDQKYAPGHKTCRYKAFRDRKEEAARENGESPEPAPEPGADYTILETGEQLNRKDMAEHLRTGKLYGKTVRHRDGNTYKGEISKSGYKHTLRPVRA